MQEINFKQLGEVIKKVFVSEGFFQMKKIITEFHNGERFLGDFFTFLIREEVTGESPIFYSVVSPFDAVNNKEAYAAQMYRDGEIIFSGDFKKYTAIRTGLLSPLIIETLGESLSEKKILIVGTGKLALNGVKALQELFPNISTISYTSQSGKKESFEQDLRKENFTLEYAQNANFSEFDIILFYTNAKESILKDSSQIKDNAIVASHISSTSYAEYSDEVYKEANVIIDWQENRIAMKDLGRALEQGYITENNILSFRDILDGKTFSSQRRYTLIRSTGTPMQNVAVLKYLTGEGTL